MKRYLKYIIMGIVAVTLYTLFFPGKDKEKGNPRDYQTIVESGILRAVTEYNSISYFADGDTVSGFHYELLNAFARSKGLTPEIIPEMSFEKRQEGILTGKYDILANSTIVTSESKDSLLFTHPILLNKQVLVQRKPEQENDSMYIHSQLELARKTLHVVKGCDESIAQASINDFPQLDIKTAISFTQFYSWGVSKHSPILLDSLNAWLDTYTLTPEFRELQKKYYNK